MGLKLKLLRGPHENLQGNPWAELWRWRNNSGTFYILFPTKGIMNYRQIISSRLYVRIKLFLPSKELVHSLVENL